MRPLSTYGRIGVVLLVAGAIGTPVFYFVAESIPLTALGLSALLLGFISLMLNRSVPSLPQRVAQTLLEAGRENLAGLFEELGVDAKAIYLPSALAGGKSKALIPLNSNAAPSMIPKPASGRLIVEYGPGDDDVGILVSTPGTSAVQFLDGPPGPSSSDLESALTRILVGVLDVARTVQVSQDGGQVHVRVGGVGLNPGELRLDEVLGSPLASVVAAVIAEATGRPVAIVEEERRDGNLTVRVQGIG